MSKQNTKIQIIILKEILQKITIIDGIPTPGYLAFDSLVKELAKLYTNKKVIIKEKVIGDAITVNVMEYYSNSKYSKDEIPANGSTLGSLSEINLENLANQIDRLINSYPRNYKFVFPLPNIPITNFSAKLKHNVEIKTISEGFLEQYKLRSKENEKEFSMGKYIELTGATPYSVGDSVLEINISGYVTIYGETLKNDLDPLYIFKVVFAYFEISDLFEINYSQKFKNTNYRYKVFDTQSKALITTVNQPSDTLEFIESRSFKNLIDEKATVAFNQCIENLELILNNDESIPREYSRLRIGIMNALYWYFEVSKTDNIHLKTIFLTTTIDSFFQGSDTEKVKAEYIATLIGPSLNTQRRILDYLTKLFKERNSIIHGEKQIDSSENLSMDNKDSPFVLAHVSSSYIDSFIENRIELYIKSIKMLREDESKK